MDTHLLSNIFLSQGTLQGLHSSTCTDETLNIYDEFRCKNRQMPLSVKSNQVYYATDNGSFVLVEKWNACKIRHILLIIRLIQSVLFQKPTYPVLISRRTDISAQPIRAMYFMMSIIMAAPGLVVLVHDCTSKCTLTTKN